MDNSRRKIFWQADLEQWLHKLWRVVVVVQDGTQDRGCPRQRTETVVPSLDCRQKSQMSLYKGNFDS